MSKYNYVSVEEEDWGGDSRSVVPIEKSVGG